MKKLVLLLLWVGICAAHAQLPDTAATRIPARPMSSGWRYHVGDNPAWARPDFDASAWDTINLRKPRYTLPPAAQTGTYWLRWRFRLSDSLRRQALLLGVWRLGATDIYLNGQQVTKPADRTRTVYASVPAPVEVPANGPAEQVLAVRFTPWQPSPLLLGTSRLPLLRLWRGSVAEQRHADANQAVSVGFDFLLATVYLLLALLHYAYIHYNPSQRANQYFAQSMLAFSAGWVVLAYVSGAAVLPSWHWVVALYLLKDILWLVGGVLVLLTVYNLFGFRRGLVWVGLVVSGGLLTLLNTSTCFSPWSGLPNILFVALVFAEQLRLTVRALRQRQRGVLIIVVGYVVALVSLLLHTYILFILNDANGLGHFLRLSLIIISPPLSFSLYLAREFALGAELLLVKLREVEQLSAQTLAQEQEKQALLASQNERLETQVGQRTSELQHSLTELRQTQAQLIQREKMASLGELTAGIAHEIQNPLNFVNNFADVSQELVQELKEAQEAGDSAEVAVLAADLGQNLEKIHQHGQRAAGIVRGMLGHSRASTGQRQPTDLNALADEYLRLAYHGLRAKDKAFNATLQTDFAPNLPPVEAVPGDLGRVLLNLLTNAFYAVRQRQQAGEVGYVPTVRVQTRVAGQQVQVRVADNGAGIPDSLKAKIFQPFFTTKPTGEGTGLGLSLAYDIVTEGHGGTLSMESQPGQGTEFIVDLPA